MNKVFEIGYIGKKGVELKFTAGEGKAVATYSIGVPRPLKKGEYDYFNCVTWNKQGEFLANNQDKIKKVLVEGRLQSRSYDGKNGKVYVTEIVTDNVEVVEWKNEAADTGNEHMEQDSSTDDIPFN